MRSIRKLLSVLVAGASLTACSSDCGCRSRCASPCAPPPCSPCGSPCGRGYGMQAPAGPAYGQGSPQAAPPSGYGQPGTAGPAQPPYVGTPPAGQAGTGTAPPSDGQEAGVVTVQNHAYSPATLTVRAGTVVRWVNRDPDAHTATGNGFDVQIPPGGQGTYTFWAPGTYDVTCRYHPTMKGQVVVR